MKNLSLTLFVSVLLLISTNCSNVSGPDLAGGTDDHGNALIAGKLVYPDGTPAASARVELSIESEPTLNTSNKSFLIDSTDQYGNFSFSGLAAGNYIVNSFDGRNNGSIRFCQYAGNNTNLMLPADTLKTMGVIKGRLIPQDSNTAFSRNAYAVLWHLGRVAYLNDNGDFIFTSIPAGNYQVRCQSSDKRYLVLDSDPFIVAPACTTLIGEIQLPLLANNISDSLYRADTLAVRALLDSNGILKSIKDVSWVLNGRVTYIQYNGNLKVIPASIGNLTALTYFGAFGTKSTTINRLRISEEIGKCKALQVIEISQMNLDSLPETLKSLPVLHGINFSGNKFKMWPEVLTNCINLKELNLSDNFFDSLPANIENLSQLILLNVSFNKLRQLPQNISKLSRLQTLKISSNSLGSLPDSIGQMTALKEVSVRLNQITSIPLSITKLNCNIDVAYNHLCNVSDTVNTWLNNHYCPYLSCNPDRATDSSWKLMQTCP
ncbi:MAG: hypothetical protein JNL74_20585 [Fibrobacteres bacterium]|nr:hypothetical protein [Fibrobacterota bacterium]